MYGFGAPSLAWKYLTMILTCSNARRHFLGLQKTLLLRLRLIVILKGYYVADGIYQSAILKMGNVRGFPKSKMLLGRM
jgi:hypothetical protein